MLLKPLSDNQYSRLLEAKRLRLLDENEENRHFQQCSSILDEGFDGTIHGVHLNPCDKKFTHFIATSQKRSVEESKVTGRLKQIRTSTNGSCSTVGLFPKESFVCKKLRKTVKTKTYIPYKITTINAEMKIKEAAEMKNDHKLLGQIQDVALIAKELMMHKCYLECLSSKTKDTAQEDIQETQGDFDKVK